MHTHTCKNVIFGGRRAGDKPLGTEDRGRVAIKKEGWNGRRVMVQTRGGVQQSQGAKERRGKLKKKGRGAEGGWVQKNGRVRKERCGKERRVLVQSRGGVQKGEG